MRNYIHVDKKEPRFRVSKYRFQSINREMFAEFEQKHPNIKMDYLTFKDIIMAINQEIVNLVIDNRDGVFLPKGMGRLYLGLYPFKVAKKIEENGKIKKVLLDFQIGNSQGKIMWSWSNVKYRTDNLNYFSFIGHRDFKTRASHAFINNPERYVRDIKSIRKEEILKRKEYGRTKINSQICDQPIEDAIESSEWGFETD